MQYAQYMHKKVSLLSIEHPAERFIFNTLFVTLMLLLAGYLYFVASSVLNIIARKEASAQTTALQSGLAGMEKEYFMLTQGMTAGKAASIGLAPLKSADYLYRPGNAASAASPATIGSNEI